MLRSLTALMLVIPAAAQQADDIDSQPVHYAEETEVVFDRGLEVDGELVGPRDVVVQERRPSAFAPMIELRESFGVELAESVDAVK